MNVIEQPLQERDLLGAVLVDDVVVGHRQRVGEAEVDLLLARPRLALRRLDAHPGGLHPVPDLAQEGLVVGRREDVVVEDVRHRRRQPGVLLGVRLLERLAEEIELELAAHHRRQAECRRPLHLRLQHLPRRRLRPASRRGSARRRARAPSPRARGSGAASPCRAARRSRRSPAPSSRSRSPARGPSPSRGRAGSCTPPPRAPRPSRSTKNSPWRRLPIRRPCMSVNATTTVSIAPLSTSARSSSKVSMEAILFRPGAGGYCGASRRSPRTIGGMA